MAAIRKSRAGDCNQWSGSPHSFRSNTPDWHAFGFRPDSRRYRKQCPHADLSDEASPDDRTMATRPAKSDTPTRRHALLHPHLKLDLPVWPPQGDGISTWCHWARLGINHHIWPLFANRALATAINGLAHLIPFGQTLPTGTRLAFGRTVAATENNALTPTCPTKPRPMIEPWLPARRSRTRPHADTLYSIRT